MELQQIRSLNPFVLTHQTDWSPFKPGFFRESLDDAEGRDFRKQPPVRWEWRVFNTTGFHLMISDRMGIVSSIPPTDFEDVDYRQFAKEHGVNQIKHGFYFRYTVTTIHHKDPEKRVAEFDVNHVIENQTRVEFAAMRMNERFIRNDGHFNQQRCTRGLNKGYYEMERYADFFVPFEALLGVEDIVYVQDIDLYLSTRKRPDMILHLESAEGAATYGEYKPEPMHANSVGVEIVHVDNSGKHPPYYVNLSGFISQVKPIHNLKVRDGVYVYQREGSPSLKRPDLLSEVKRPEVYSIEDVLANKTKLNFFLTEKEAETLGDQNLKLREEAQERERVILQQRQQYEDEKHKHEMALQTLKSENLERQSAYDKLKAENDRKLLEKQIEIDQLKAQLDKEKAERESWLETQKAFWMKEKLAMEKEIAKLKDEIEKQSLQRKDHYDARSSSRKDSSEGWSTAGKVIVAACAIGVAIVKFVL